MYGNGAVHAIHANDIHAESLAIAKFASDALTELPNWLWKLSKLFGGSKKKQILKSAKREEDIILMIEGIIGYRP